MNSRISRRLPVSGELGAPTNSFWSSSPALLLCPVARAPCDVRPSAMRVLLRTYVLAGTVPAPPRRGKHSFDFALTTNGCSWLGGGGNNERAFADVPTDPGHQAHGSE